MRNLKTKLDEELLKIEALKDNARKEGRKAILSEVDSRIEEAIEAGRKEIVFLWPAHRRV